MKEALDTISTAHPMFLVEEGGHSAWVNSAALVLAGIDANTATPKGGIIMRDEQGSPSGTLRESAMLLVRKHVPAPVEADRLNALRAAMVEANRFGVTAMVDAMVSPDRDALYLKLARKSELTVRMNLAYHLTPNWDEDFDALSKRFRNDSEYLRGTQIKLWMDGVVEAQTAAMKAPYVGQPDNTGLLMYTDEQLNRWVPELEARGFQMHMHTIGDAAVDQALTALEASRKQNNAPNRRPYLIHNYFVDKADYPRILAAGATANFTMLWDQLEGVMRINTLPYLTEEQRPNIMPMGQLHDAGIVVTGGSDWPVSQISPLASIEVAVTGGAVPYHVGAPVDKAQPVMIGERVDLETMIRAYTINAAYAAQQEGVMGSITIGKFADLVVLENNLFRIPATEIAETQIDLTVVGGKIVFRRETPQLKLKRVAIKH
jgi:predicted amidohydrolase YtcJ